MSKENVRLFYEALVKDKALQEKIKLAGKKYEGRKPDKTQMDLICQNEIIPLAKESGFDFTLVEFKEYVKETGKSRTGELTDSELSAVAGGSMCECLLLGFGGSLDSVCVVVGGGNTACACTIFGSGQNSQGKWSFWILIGIIPVLRTALEWTL